MTATSTPTTARSPVRGPHPAAPRPHGRAPAPPVLVRQIRNGIAESDHRGHVVEADAGGRIIRLLGDPDRLVALRSTVKPFGVAALVEAGGIEAFELSPEELAIMTSSHSGEDLHVRTLQGMYRRAGISQSLLACGTQDMPLDALTSARLARDGERPSPVRHMCSGQHSVFLLLCRLNGWPYEEYWLEDHPAQVAYRGVVARAFGTTPERLRLATDGCGVPTYGFTLRELARAYAFLAEPSAIGPGDGRHDLGPALEIIRDAMLAYPEMVGGTRDRFDTSLMKALPGRTIAKAGMEALRGIAIVPGRRTNGVTAGPAGMVVKIEDGDGHDRATWAASVEALRQAGVLDGQPLRMLARYHHPPTIDPHGRLVAAAIPSFELVPVGELTG